MLYIALIAFILLAGKAIRDNIHAENESQAEQRFYQNEYSIRCVSDQ